MAGHRGEQEGGGGMIFKQWRFETDCTDGQHHQIERIDTLPLVCSRCGVAATDIREIVQPLDVRRQRPPRGGSQPN